MGISQLIVVCLLTVFVDRQKILIARELEKVSSTAAAVVPVVVVVAAAAVVAAVGDVAVVAAVAVVAVAACDDFQLDLQSVRQRG